MCGHVIIRKGILHGCPAARKDYLRRAIEDCAAKSINENAFRENLKKEYGITLTISRGRYGYIHPDRSKPIRGRMLGTDYEEKHLQEIFDRNARKDTRHLSEIETRSQESQPTRKPENKNAHQSAKTLADNYGQRLTETPVKKNIDARRGAITNNNVQPLPSAITTESKLRLVTDLQSCVKAKANYYYARKVRISNLQKMAETVAYAQEHNFDSYDEVENMHDKALLELRKSRGELDDAKEELRNVNEQIHFTGQYLSTKKIYAGYKKAKDMEKYRSNHQADLVKFESSRDYLRKRADGKNFQRWQN